MLSAAPSCVKLSAWKPDADQCRDEEYRAKRDALRVDGYRPPRHELVARRPDSERGILDKEKTGLPGKRALDSDDSTVPQPPAALHIQLSPEPRPHVCDHVPLASSKRLGSILASPFRRGFIERAIDPMVEVAKRLEPGGHLPLARGGIPRTRRVPEPRVVPASGRSMNSPRTRRSGPAAPTALRNRRLFMPSELLGESGIDSQARSCRRTDVGIAFSGCGALLPNPDAVHVLERQVPARMERAGATPSGEPTASPWSARNLGEAP